MLSFRPVRIESRDVARRVIAHPGRRLADGVDAIADGMPNPTYRNPTYRKRRLE